jgi:MFS family permease
MSEPSGTRTPGLLRRRHAPDWLILALACVAQFMVILDVSVVNVALPSIGRDLHYSPVGLQWVVNAYVLTFAGFLLLGGRAADSFGRRRVFLTGLLLFVGTSIIGGFAQSAGWLTAARAVQGIGGAALSPATLTIIITTFSGRRLARALGLWSAMGGAGGAIGVLLGGVLTAELSWRWVLFINGPIGLVTGVAAIIFLGEARGTGPRQRLDVPGAVAVTAGLAALAYAIVGTDQYSWGSAHTLGWLAAGLVLLAVFLVLQLRGKAPLMPLRLFRMRGVTGANIVMLLVGAVFFSMWYFLSLYVQDVLGYGPLRAGVAFVPMGIAIIIGAQATSRAMPGRACVPCCSPARRWPPGASSGCPASGPTATTGAPSSGRESSSPFLSACSFPRWQQRPLWASGAPRRALPPACSTRRARSAARLASRSWPRRRARTPMSWNGPVRHRRTRSRQGLPGPSSLRAGSASPPSPPLSSSPAVPAGQHRQRCRSPLTRPSPALSPPGRRPRRPPTTDPEVRPPPRWAAGW